MYFAVADLDHFARIRFRNLCRFASGFEIASFFVVSNFLTLKSGVHLLFFIFNYKRKEFWKWKHCWRAPGKAQGHNYPWSLFEVILFNFLYTGAVLLHGSSYGGKGVLWWDKAFFPQSNQVLKTAALTWAVCQLWPSILKGKAKNQLWISTVSYGSVPYLIMNTGCWLLLLKTEIKSVVKCLTVPDQKFFDPGSLIWIFDSGSRVWIFSSRIRNTEPTNQ